MKRRKHGNYAPGASRSSRALKELEPDYFRVDERSLIDLLVFAGKFSEYINYYDKDNQYKGSWEQFFANDQAVLLSAMANSDLESYEKYVNNFSDRLISIDNEQEKMKRIPELFRLVRMIPTLLDYWYAQMVTGEGRNPIVLEMTSAIEGKLSRELSRLKHYEANALHLLGVRGLPDYSNFSSLWSLSAHNSFGPAFTGEDVKEKIEDGVNKVMGVCHAFIDAIRYIVSKVRTNLEQSLLARDDHKPHMAMYITFLKLFGHAQELLNRFTGKHLDFYYFNVLQQSAQPAVADKVFVHFELVPHAEVCLLPKGSKLLAGKSVNGSEQYYVTDNDIYVNQTIIADLKTIFVSREEGIVTGSSRRIVKGIFASPAPASATDEQGKWCTFGEEQFRLGKDERTLEDASLGFALASPAFILNEGQRSVTVSVSFAEEDFHELKEIVEEIARNEYRTPKDAAARILSNGFNIKLSTIQGWLNIDRYIITMDLGKRMMRLRFNLASPDPAVTGYDSENHGNRYATQWPVLELLLSPDAPVFPYSLLAKLLITDIRITTSVEGAHDLDLFNDLGRLDPSKPFQPFGPVPGSGASLLIGFSEMFRKELEELKVTIEWQDLPPEGLAEYYKSYGLGITNSSFKTRVSMLKDGAWAPGPLHRQSFQLFNEIPAQRIDEKPLLSDHTVLDPGLVNMHVAPEFSLPVTLDYDPSVQHGFLRLELYDPPFAFAHAEYSRILSETITWNAKHKRDIRPVPPVPFAPVIHSLSLDYTASLSLRSQGRRKEQAIQLFHLHPFGTREIAPASGIISNSLLPRYEEEGSLYIGLADLRPPQPLNILFQLAGGGGGVSGRAGDEVTDVKGDKTQDESREAQWSYLADDTWIPFRKENVLSDSTKNFVQSGIVSLDIPANIIDCNTIMPGGLYWIKVCIPYGSKLAAKTVTIKTQAVTATWLPDVNAPEHLDRPLPADTIKKLVTSVPEIKKVHQPFPSFNGRPVEKKEDMYIRISERLRHKDRGVTVWDMERLVLQNFPSVYMAQCFPGASSSEPDRRMPGHVMLVVIPGVRSKEYINIYRPRNSFSTLQEIHDFMKKRISPFVRLEVRDPAYEWVKIACKVKFKKGADGGFYLRQLNEDIKRYLSPWLFDDEAVIRLGGSIYKSDILGFIERRPYIDFITGFSVIVTTDQEGFYTLIDTAQTDQEELIPATLWSVMVSANRHDIQLVSEEKYQQPERRAIGKMVIGEDFIIT